VAPVLLWHTYPLGVLGADQTGADRGCPASLRQLVDWLPHVAGLGADGLLLAPVFASLSHGYDTVDHLRVDERLGGTADLDTLIAAARGRGISVFLDGAFAYASRSFRRLTDPAEREDPWFLLDRNGELVPWRVDALVTPDADAPGYRAYVAEVLTYWLDRGIAGWRLDSAWSLPADFWQDVLSRVRERHPQAWFLGQYFHTHLPRVVGGTTVSSATEYTFTRKIRAWLSAGDPAEMAETTAAALDAHARNCAAMTPHTFLGNHDIARLADTIPTDLLPAAFAVLLTVPGIPAIYYGDEFAVTSGWHPGGDDALLRPPLSPVPDGDLLATVRQLGTFRAARPWLTTAHLGHIATVEGAVTYQVTGAGEHIRVGINPTTNSVTLPAINAFAAMDLPPRSWALHNT
jgi:glycosidase